MCGVLVFKVDLCNFVGRFGLVVKDNVLFVEVVLCDEVVVIVLLFLVGFDVKLDVFIL